MVCILLSIINVLVTNHERAGALNFLNRCDKLTMM